VTDEVRLNYWEVLLSKDTATATIKQLVPISGCYRKQWNGCCMVIVTVGIPEPPNGAADTSRNHPAPPPLKNRRRAAKPAEVFSRRRHQNFYSAPKRHNDYSR